MSRRRVVITGLGIVSPVGNDVATAWSNIVAGKSGIGPITYYDVSAYSTRFGGMVRDFDASQWLSVKDVKRTDPFIHYGVAAAKQAVADSGIEITDLNRDRIGICIGSGIGGIGTIEHECRALHASGPKRVSPFLVPSSIINMISGYLSIELALTGPNFAVVSACTTGTHAIGLGARIIQAGDADMFVVGGAEAGSAPAGLAGFCQARALSTRNDEPELACRPWDRNRDGFVLGDGSGVLVVEDLEHARKRGARIYAELIGFGMSGDAYHITLPGNNGARRSMINTLRDAGLNPEQVDYVNAHATSTLAGDVGESNAIKEAFGEHAYKMSISSTKSMTGHLLGAAGGVEAIFSILALRDQIVPPTINLDDPDEGCDLDYTAHKAKEKKLEIVVSNSFGFGGTNGSVAFKRFS